MDIIVKLKEEIAKQESENKRLYEIFRYRLHEEDMQPIIEKWRKGSARVKELLNKLYEAESKDKTKRYDSAEHTKFINGFGEATRREIISCTYARAEKKLSKQIMNFVS